MWLQAVTNFVRENSIFRQQRKEPKIEQDMQKRKAVFL